MEPLLSLFFFIEFWPLLPCQDWINNVDTNPQSQHCHQMKIQESLMQEHPHEYSVLQGWSQTTGPL